MMEKLSENYYFIFEGATNDYHVTDDVNQLLDDIRYGRKYMKVYKQVKMYNDPSLNPVLYGKAK